MIHAEGLLYDGRQLEPVAARAELAGADTLLIQVPGAEIRTELSRTRVVARGPTAQGVICLPEGAQFHTEDLDWVERVFPARGLEALATRLERHPLVALIGAAGALAALAALVLLGLPRLSDRVAERLPVELEQALGQQVLALLDEAGFDESELSEARQAEVAALFSRLEPEASSATLVLRASPLGANAFAIPGGVVLVTDELAELLDRDDELLAILAHELGHHRHRHALRSAVQESALLVAAGLVGGDVGMLALAGAAIPRFLLQSHFSRAFEEEADTYALEALASHGRSPRALGDALRRLDPANAGEAGGLLSYASTHPPTQERIARSDAAARAFETQRESSPQSW